MVKKKNRNIVLIKDIKELKSEVEYKDFQYKKFFTLLCNLKPNKKKERLEVEEINNTKIKDFGLIYVFVINKKIFKIGQTINTIYDRVQSYNCGKVEHRISGSASTTNYFVLQSLLELNKKIEVYAFFPDKKNYKIFDEKGIDCFPSTKIVEKKIMKDFIKKYNKKPIGCTQK